MMVIRGATRPEAQAAEVTSDVIRHGRSLVFHLGSWKEAIEGLVGSFRVMAAESCGHSNRDWPSMLP